MKQIVQLEAISVMPIYEFLCLDCEENFSAFLRMDQEQESCEICSSDHIIKVVSDIGQKVDKDKFKAKAGDVVKSHIEEAKSEIKKEKKNLKSKVYKDD